MNAIDDSELINDLWKEREDGKVKDSVSNKITEIIGSVHGNYILYYT